MPPTSKKLSSALTLSILRTLRQISAIYVSAPAAGGSKAALRPNDLKGLGKPFRSIFPLVVSGRSSRETTAL